MPRTGTERAAGAAREMRDSFAEAADHAAAEAMAAGRTISSMVLDEIDRRGAALADGLDQISDSLRHASSGQTQKSYIVEQAVDVIDDISAQLREGTAHELGDRLTQFARRNPGAIVLAALAAGLLAGRMLVSSGSEDSGEDDEEWDDPEVGA